MYEKKSEGRDIKGKSINAVNDRPSILGNNISGGRPRLAGDGMEMDSRRMETAYINNVYEEDTYI